MDEEKVVHLDFVRIDRGKQRRCVCKTRRYEIDTTNREILCGCGLVVDPYEALYDMASRHEEMNRKMDEMNEQRKLWLKEKPHSVIFKRLEREHRKGTMLPACPACDKSFDFTDIVGWRHRDHTKLDYKE